MKKSLISLAIILIFATIITMFVPTFAAKSVPLVIDWTAADNNTIYPAAGDLPLTWSGTACGTSSYDATEGAWKMESTMKLYSWQGGYLALNVNIDWEEYKYMKFCYKTANIPDENDNPDIFGYVGFCGTGAAAITDALPLSTGAYTELVVSTERFGSTTDLLFSWCNAGLSSVAAGSTVWIKYIAFFKTEKEANSFDIEDWSGDLYGAKVEEPEVSTPEVSTPEVSEPEVSTPEVSEPEVSTPEVSEPEVSTPEVSEPEVSTPEVSEPEVSTPEVSEPEVSEPEVSEPETSTPETSEPEVSEPEVEKEPVTIFDWTKSDNDTIYPATGDLPLTWSGTPCGTSSFDETEGAWKMESNIKTWSWQGGYIAVPVDLDWEEYKYMKFCYKTANIPDENDNPEIFGYIGFCGTGAVGITDPLPLSNGAYSELIVSTERFGATAEIIPNWCNAGLTSVDAGATLWIKYIAFFKTEEEAIAFTELSPEPSAPESSTPEESSAPESSAPEVSEPETSAPESSVVESSSSDNGGSNGGSVIIYIVIAAVVIAAVVVVILLSKKKKA